MFSCWQTSNGVRKNWNIHSLTFYLHRRALWAVVSPNDDGPLKKPVQITLFGLETTNVVQSLCLMTFQIQVSNCQYLVAFLSILKPYFTSISKFCPYQGGTPRLRKSLPFVQNFFLSLTDDIFIICNLKLIKNNQKTCPNMHFKKKMPKKHSVQIPGYLPSGDPPRILQPAGLEGSGRIASS